MVSILVIAFIREAAGVKRYKFSRCTLEWFSLSKNKTAFVIWRCYTNILQRTSSVISFSSAEEPPCAKPPLPSNDKIWVWWLNCFIYLIFCSPSNTLIKQRNCPTPFDVLPRTWNFKISLYRIHTHKSLPYTCMCAHRLQMLDFILVHQDLTLVYSLTDAVWPQ